MGSDDLPPEYLEHLGRRGFVLQRVLGRGGSGSVFLAEQTSLNRNVAIKFFDSAFARDSEVTRKRFSREARLLARFQHPGFPYVITEGSVAASFGDTPYFVMEYVTGTSLKELLKQQGQLPIDVAIAYVCQVLGALEYSHSRGVLHRDLKPANIMVDENSRCFVIDFSIGVSTTGEAGLTRATKTGDYLGTPQYMSPEQLSDASKADSRTDIYSMGVVLFELLSGSPELTNIQKSLAAAPRNIVDAIESACAKNPADRYRTAQEFLRALESGAKVRGPGSTPALAICTNTKCPGADWTERGFYRGPRLANDSVHPFCTHCGKRLAYQCQNCGQPITSTPHCGNCGSETYRVPTCARCSSWLTSAYMDSLGADGCMQCIGKPAVKPAPTFDTMDDDIPF